ncbi:hypothetical protein CsSME_00002816 [Camellia sinensis var. sinensis]
MLFLDQFHMGESHLQAWIMELFQGYTLQSNHLPSWKECSIMGSHLAFLTVYPLW